MHVILTGHLSWKFLGYACRFVRLLVRKKKTFKVYFQLISVKQTSKQIMKIFSIRELKIIVCCYSNSIRDVISSFQQYSVPQWCTYFFPECLMEMKLGKISLYLSRNLHNINAPSLIETKRNPNPVDDRNWQKHTVLQ